MAIQGKRKRGRPPGRIYPEKGVPIQARVTEEMMTRIRKLARHQNTRLSDQLRIALNKHLAEAN